MEDSRDHSPAQARTWQGRIVGLVMQWGVVVLVGMMGVGLVLYGVWEAVRPSEAVVEIVREGASSDHSQEQGSELYVDVAGAVESPGVYELVSGSRIGEALSAAGGLSAEADRGWVTRYINLAEVVKDGMKIYVPGQSENSANQQIGESDGQMVGESANQNGTRININTASVSELDSLWGIGEARAQQIIDSRPYGSVEELTSKASIPTNVFERIKDEVSVY